MIRTIIVDDEPMARGLIRRFLESEPEFAIVAECRNGNEALEAIDHLKPELLFLDVQMPGMNGLEVLAAVAVEKLPAVIFTTAYEKYAIEAFERHAVDYLLKPFDRGRFQRALAHAKALLGKKELGLLSAQFQALRDELNQVDRFIDRIAVRIGDRFIVVPLKTVNWFEACGNYVRLHAPGKTYLHRESFNHLEGQLDPKRFLRIHRSLIVNLAEIKELQRWMHREYVFVLKDGAKLRASRAYSEAIRKAMKLSGDSEH